MATSLPTSVPQWLAACTYDGDGANDLRNSDVSAVFLSTPASDGAGSTIAVLGGVAGGSGLHITPGTGMQVQVQAGAFVVPNTASAIAGGYKSTLAAGGRLDVAAADPGNPRIDIVVAYVSDVGTSSSSGKVQIYTGVAAASPAAPAAPQNSITLAQIAVPAGATSITSGDISDKRPFTAAAGGVVKANKGTVTGYNGQLAFDPPSGTFYHNYPGSPRQALLLPWPPVIAIVNANQGIAYTTSGAFAATTPLTSVSITTDGATDIKITYKVPGVEQPSPGAAQVKFTIWIDETTQLDETDVATYAADQANISHGGFTGVYTTSGAAGDTPPAGTHTIDFSAAVYSAITTYAVASAGRLLTLRVEPVSL